MSPRILLAANLLLWTTATGEKIVAAEPPTPEQRAALEKQAAELEKEARAATQKDELDKARASWKKVLALRTKAFGADNWQVINAKQGLAFVDHMARLKPEQRKQVREAEAQWTKGQKAAGQGKFAEALALYRPAMDTFVKLFGADHPETAYYYVAVGGTLLYLGQVAEGEALLQRSLTIRQKELGEIHPETATSYAWLSSLRKSRGKFADAEVLDRKVLAICQQTQGEEHSNTATAYDNLGVILTDQALYADAEPYYRKALAIFQKLRGEEDTKVAIVSNNLAENLRQQGKYAEADPYYRKSLAIFQKALGEDHPSTAASYNNLASNLDDQGNYKEGELLHRKALAIREKVWGEDHSDTADSCSNLAMNLQYQGKHAEAEAYYHRAFAIFQKALGMEHPRTATSCDNLATILHARGKNAEAELLSRKALVIRRKMLGETHPETLTSYNNLANQLTDAGKFAEAEPLFRRCLDILKTSQGEEHPRMVLTWNNLGWCLQEQEKYTEADQALRRAVALGKKVLLGHPSTVHAMTVFADNLRLQKKYPEAEQYYRESLELRQRLLGKEHPDTAAAQANLALLLNLQGKFADAEPLLMSALEVRRKAWGDNHAAVVRTRRTLAATLSALGRNAEALEMARAAARAFEATRSAAGLSGLDRAAFGARNSPLPQLAALLARAGQPAEAWEQLEKDLARGLLDDLAARHGRPLTEAEQKRDDELRDRLTALDKQLTTLAELKDLTPEQQQRRAALRQERDVALAELAQFQAELEKKYGPAAGAVYDLAHIQKTLPADAALVAWLDLRTLPGARDPRGDHWACLVPSRGVPVWIRLGGSGPAGAWTDADEDMPQRLAKLFRDRRGGGEEWRELAAALTAQRLAPLAEHLGATSDRPTIKHLIVLASPALAGLPLETLTDRCSISYAPSGTMFAHLQEQHAPPAEGRLLALGDPTFTAPPKAVPSPGPPDAGVVVISVTPGANAAVSGIEVGDVLVRYAGSPVASIAEVRAATARVAQDPPRDGVPVELWREGIMKTVTVRPGLLGIQMDAGAPPAVIGSRRAAVAALRASRGDVFTPLPGTRREVEALAHLFADARVLLGSDASETVLTNLAGSGGLREYRYLHLATHGVAQPQFGLGSYLALAQDKLPDPVSLPSAGAALFDGKLTAEQILRWKLNADLVTLSACETGLGQKQGGEGFVGFSQALFIAGARSVVLSQWKVDDQATALLMQRFYQNLLGQRPGLEQPLGKAAALAEAKRWLRQLHAEETTALVKSLPAARGLEVVPATPEAGSTQPYAHPYYWAAFILVGDPGDIAQAVPVLAPSGDAGVPADGGFIQHWPWLVGVGTIGAMLVLWRWRRTPAREVRP